MLLNDLNLELLLCRASVMHAGHREMRTPYLLGVAYCETLSKPYSSSLVMGCNRPHEIVSSSLIVLRLRPRGTQVYGYASHRVRLANQPLDDTKTSTLPETSHTLSFIADINLRKTVPIVDIQVSITCFI